MNIVVCYRSREQTNSIMSSTKQNPKILNLQSVGVNIEYINLDKRNYQKYLKQAEVLPIKVFLWFDEEVTADFIKENYPSIEIIYYSKESSVTYSIDCFGKRKEYNLSDLIIQSIEKTFAIFEIWEVKSEGYNYKIIKREVSEFTYNLSKFKNIFDTYEKAKEYVINIVEYSIKRDNEGIISSKDAIERYKARIKKSESLLKKFKQAQ